VTFHHGHFLRVVLLSVVGFMQWRYPIQDVHEASLRAERAEKLGAWHIVVQQCLYCLERSQQAQDHQAIHFFATKLSNAYRAMKLFEKATFYNQLALT
jgi:hypothetical protein